MYTKTRNIKMNPQVSKGFKKVEPMVKRVTRKIKSKGFKEAEPMVKRVPRKFKSEGRGKYKFPHYDEVPSGRYFSKVIEVIETTTNLGKPALEVLYEIKDGITSYQIANGKLPEDTKIPSYYIKQRYPEGSLPYDSFLDSMAEALEKNDLIVDDFAGVTEYVTLSYDKCDIGGFSERTPCEWEGFVGVRFIEQSEPECCQEPDTEAYEEAAETDEDEDFDFDIDWDD